MSRVARACALLVLAVAVRCEPAGSGAGCGSGSGEGSGAGCGSGSGEGSGAYYGSGSGEGSGAYYGSGSGEGSGASHGSGSGEGSGAYYGSGSGEGSGAYYRSGSGEGSGAYYGSGSGEGSGAGCGSGSGEGSGAGCGSGSGEGSGAYYGSGIGEGSGAYYGSGSGEGSGAGHGSGSGEGSGAYYGSGSGEGSGAGYGSGSAEGSGVGYGSGSGKGSGAYYGSGSGEGSEAGYGSGSGEGSGAGYGLGSAEGSGVGYGSGSGKGSGAYYGSGSGEGSGAGYGSGSGEGSGAYYGSGSGEGSGAGCRSGSREGSGAYYGSGSGEGSGAGCGSGSGEGSGAYYGSGSGEGRGAGCGSGSGEGSGAGHGSGSGEGSGVGCGSGSGEGSGEGSGAGGAAEYESGSGEGSGAGGESWTVRTRGGAVRGRRAAAGYYSFFGVPYGAPPTGEYRFKPARPAAPWAGVLAADARRLCPQPPTRYSRAPRGAEDCLALDVFAPAPRRAPRAVYVHAHGGAYLFDMRPLTSDAVRYLLEHDIIVVAVNYRLGPLGWLCLGTAAAPGNAGLHDLVLALRWLRDNIATFGGDPSRVALAGRSAGAYAAHTLALAPAAAGLFQRLIGSDGTALIDKNLMTYPVTTARDYARKLGFDSDDVEELARFYREAPVATLLNQSLNFMNMDNGELGFGVCVERPLPGVESLVPQTPALTLSVNTRPTLFTYCNDEGSLKAADLINKNREYNEEFPIFMPANMHFPDLETKYAVANELRAFYFGNETITTASRVAFGAFWGDRQYVYQAVLSAAELTARGVPAFLLEFTYEGGLSQKKPEPTAPGAGHPDFFNYLMPQKEVDNEDDLRIVKEITSIVAEFVKTGRGYWPAAEPGLRRVSALRVARAGAAPLSSELPPALALWHRLYARYRRTDYSPLAEPGIY